MSLRLVTEPEELSSVHACLPHSRSALPIIEKASFSLSVIPYISCQTLLVE